VPDAEKTMRSIFNFTALPANQAFFQTQGVITMTNKDVYIAKMKMQLDELDGQMSVLEARAKEAKDDARAKYEEEMAKLHEQSKLAQGKLDSMKSATAEAWDATVAEMEKVRDAFVHSFSYFKSQL
jgi:predicted  nucleic acid-binding Zn-ribbon protein